MQQRLKRLIELTDIGIGDLREFVNALREGVNHEVSLLASVRRFCSRFQEATGIAVDVKAGGLGRINDRLAAEVFQMIIEGLSNIRRHTQSARASIQLGCSLERLLLRIEDDGQGQTGAPHFMPASELSRSRDGRCAGDR